MHTHPSSSFMAIGSDFRHISSLLLQTPIEQQTQTLMREISKMQETLKEIPKMQEVLYKLMKQTESKSTSSKTARVVAN